MTNRGEEKPVFYVCEYALEPGDSLDLAAIDMGDGTTMVKVVSWYDNENSYTSQMVRTIKYFAELA